MTELKLLDIHAELPSGRTITMREPRGADELAAAADGGEEGNAETRALVGTWSLMMRCTVAINGEPLDQSKVTPQSYRDLFNTRDYMKVRDLWFDTFYALTAEANRKFEESKRGSAAS